MAAGKKMQNEMNPDTPSGERSLRDSAEKQLARSPKHSPELKGKTSEQFIYELQVRQIELETQAEELRKSKIALEESRDKFLDLYEFAPTGYITLNDKALITEVNQTCTKLFGVERDKLVNHGLGRFIAPGDHEVWNRYFAKVRQHIEKQNCTLTLIRADGSTFPARLEGDRFTGSGGAYSIRIAISDITDIWQIEALKENEQKYRNLIKNSALGIFHSTFEGRFIDVNPALVTMLGYTSPEEVLTSVTSIAEQVYADPPLHDATATDAIKAGGTVSRENRYHRRDGTLWYGKLHLRIVHDPEGKPSHYEGFVEDITERKDAEDALRESEKRFHSMFERHDSIMLLIAPDSGKIIEANLAAARFYGRSQKELCSQFIDEINIMSQEEVAAEMMKATREQKNFFTFSHRLASGEIRTVEVHSSPIDIGGKTILFSIINDITERKRMEDAVHASAKYTRSLIEASLDPLVTISPEGRITDVNAATEHVTGYSRDELSGTDFSDYFTDPKRAKEGYRMVFDNGVVWDYPLEIRHRDGKILSVLYNAAIYRDESGKVLGVFAAARDITERKRAEDALRLSNKKLTLLSSITRHDINNQLMTLNGFLGMLQRKVPDPTLEDYFTKIKKASERIAVMIKFTKEYEKIGVDAPIWQDCRKLVETATKQAPLGKVSVKNDLPAITEVFADPLIVKVFYNLMDNAAR